jgi:autophagy-related protein 2
MIRVQIRCPSLQCGTARSGALVLDLHELRLQSGTYPRATLSKEATFDPLSRNNQDMVPRLNMEVRRVLVAYAPVGDHLATAVVSLSQHPLSLESSSSLPSPIPHISISDLKTSDAPMFVEMFVPSVYVNLPKRLFDGLQYWIDDLSGVFQDAATVDNQSSGILGSQYSYESSSGSSRAATKKHSTGSGRKSNITVKLLEGIAAVCELATMLKILFYSSSCFSLQ